MKLKPKLVEFLCCGDSHTFTGYGEFKMCKCGASGYDHGDGYICRTLGNPKLIKFTWVDDNDVS